MADGDDYLQGNSVVEALSLGAMLHFKRSQVLVRVW